MTSNGSIFASSPGNSVGVSSMAGSSSNLLFGTSGDYSWVSKDVSKVGSVYNSLDNVIILRLWIHLLVAEEDKGLFECVILVGKRSKSSWLRTRG